MKKPVAIALLCLNLFSLCGHLLLYHYFVYRADIFFNDQISKNRYNIHDLVEIKVPIYTSTTQNWDLYEKVSGQIQFRNTCYNYVKLKLTRDTIYLMCIPNYEKTRLCNENIINARDIADIPVNKKDHVPFGKIVDLGNYNHPVILFNFLPSTVDLQACNCISGTATIQHPVTIPRQPPKAVSQNFGA